MSIKIDAIEINAFGNPSFNDDYDDDDHDDDGDDNDDDDDNNMEVNKVWWLCLVPTSTTRFASDVGYRMAKIKHSCTREIFFMNNDI